MEKKQTGFFTVCAIITIMLVMIQCNEIKSQPITLCDTGIEYIAEVVVQPTLNKLIVTNISGNQIFIVAMDFNRDGNYTMMLFDINGNGMADLQFTNGTATAEQVLMIYCRYLMLEMS